MKCPKCEKGTLTKQGALTYCLNCGYEPPVSQAVVAVAPIEDAKPAEFSIQSSRQLGRACVQRAELLLHDAALLQARIDEFRAEAGKLTKVAEFCEVAIPDALRQFAAPKAGKKAGAPTPMGRGRWTCPDCGHATVNRWIARHREEECPKRASA